jgi:hypothetical protein
MAGAWEFGEKHVTESSLAIALTIDKLLRRIRSMCRNP